MKKKMFHKYTLTELLYESKLDESAREFFDEIAFYREYQEKNDPIGIYFKKIEDMKREAQRRVEEADAVREEQERIKEEHALTKKRLEREANEFRQAYEQLSKLGFSASLFEDNYGIKELESTDLVNNLEAFSRVIKRVEKAEQGLKLAHAIVGFTGIGLAAALGAVTIGTGGLGVFALAMMAKGIFAMEKFPDVRDGLDFMGTVKDESGSQSKLIVYGFDPDVVGLIGTDANITSIFDGRFLESEMNKITSKEQHTVTTRMAMISYNAKRSKKGKSMWTMQRFQDFCVRHFNGVKVMRTYQVEKPRSGFVNWVEIEKDLDSLVERTRLGYDKWAGGLDDTITRSFREVGEFFSFGFYKNQFNLRDKEIEHLKNIENAETALRRKLARVTQASVDKKKRKSGDIWASFDKVAEGEIKKLEAERRRNAKDRAKEKERAINSALQMNLSLI